MAILMSTMMLFSFVLSFTPLETIKVMSKIMSAPYRLKMAPSAAPGAADKAFGMCRPNPLSSD